MMIIIGLSFRPMNDNGMIMVDHSVRHIWPSYWLVSSYVIAINTIKQPVVVAINTIKQPVVVAINTIKQTWDRSVSSRSVASHSFDLFFSLCDVDWDWVT